MKLQSPCSLLRLALLTVAVAIPFVSSAATVFVTVGPNASLTFSPANVTIQAGDTVTWQWAAGLHSTTSGNPGAPDGLWDSGVIGAGSTFSHTFNTTGNFPYYCTPHAGFGMVGVVSVQAPQNQPPTVSLGSPADNSVVDVPGTIKLQATAADTDGQITRVEFYDGSTILGMAVRTPYEINLTLGRGAHTITAKAYDNAGGATTSGAAHITVNAAAGVSVGAISPSGNDVSVAINDGNGPWVLQRTDDVFCNVWVNDKVTSARTAAATGGDPAKFLRVADLAERDTILFSATLSGDAERPTAVTTTGTGSALLRLKGDLLVFNITYSGLSGAATLAHIHGPAAASESAGVLVNLQPFNGGAFGTRGSLSGEVILTPAQKEDLLSGRTYINIHTDAHGTGEIRGQILPAAFQARMAGTYQRPNRVTTSAQGFGAFLLVGNELSFNIFYEGLSGAATLAHIHGPAGVDTAAGVLINLDPYKGTGFGTSGTFVGTVTLSPDQLAAVADGLTYVNVHTSANPTGEIRGQILPQVSATPFTAVLSGDAEKPNAVTTSATGSAIFLLEGHILNFSLRYDGLSGTATLAHIHGPADSTTSAGVMIDLSPYVDGAFGAGGNLAGSIVLTDPQRANILAGKTYVNIHTAANTAGEIRGQISPVTYSGALNGFNERPTQITSAGSGFATAALVGRNLHFNLRYSNLATTANNAHIHGPADSESSAGVLLDLAPFALGSFSTQGNFAGKSTLSTSTAGALVDGKTYFNIHTTANTDGELRGQINH
ncbi:CHRD domain-containing protein [bacterium]|nr:CHRD domain-containing protein [bacterium]